MEENTEINQSEYLTAFNILKVTEESYLAEIQHKLLKIMQKQPKRSKKTGKVGGWCCKICEKHSCKTSFMMEHIEAFHMERIQTLCEYCDKTFKQTVMLRKHKLNDHLRNKKNLHKHLNGEQFGCYGH